MNPSEDRISSTRERLLDEALTLFSQRGYSSTGIRDILSAAGVTQPTLYHHFKNKAELLQVLIERHYGENHRKLSQTLAAESTVRNKLRAFARGSFDVCCRDPRVPRLMFQTYFGPTVPEIDGVLDKLTDDRFRLVVSIMEDGMREGELRASHPEFLALAFCSMIDQPLNLFSRRSRPRRYLTQELADAIVELFLEGSGALPLQDKPRKKS